MTQQRSTLQRSILEAYAKGYKYTDAVNKQDDQRPCPVGRKELDIFCCSQSAVYHCKVTFIQFLFIWERRQKSILEQVVFSGGYQSSCSPFQNTQEPPLWLQQIPYDRAHCTRALSFLARGIGAILNF